MSRGDYVDVTYRTGAGIAVHRIMARSVGSTVGVTEGKANETFVKVEELNKADEAVQTARFAKSEVVAIIEGHETKAATKTKKIKVKAVPE